MSQGQQAAALDAAMNQSASQLGAWHPVCALEDIWPNMGVCALVEGRQIAIFRLQDNQLYALDNYDPHSDANVLSRGIVGDLSGERVVASPIYKHHYQLRTGVCVEDASISLKTYSVELRDDTVWVQV
ncbi:nitrite reductase small subunit NirD [Methylophilus sp.]|jgi:nitrite reductase (NADH) small subunit|uniref:nitrite reductase small subunit NirD n=1 Tax=Methylophilus sp. TaxID=29541 RepID=UPI0011D98598|nr:nitrite reductase small subunit NirD [Methylophilus sp.]TXI44906.1 MAG: nitrite reductase small subunit NirD [Methylophilus sp.]